MNYICLRCIKSIKFLNNLTRYIQSYKIPITLSSCQPSKLVVIFEFSLKVSNNSNKQIRFKLAVTIGDNNKDIKPADINQ